MFRNLSNVVSFVNMLNKANMHPRGLLQPLSISQQILKDISIEFILGLPIFKSFSMFIVVVDHLSKYDHFIPLKTNFTSTW